MSLRKQLVDVLKGTVIVMGIGNLCRGDDAAGSRVAKRICSVPNVSVIDAQDVPENYLCQVEDRQPDTVVLIDAVDLNSAPGSVALLDEGQTAVYWPSTHRVPLCLLVDFLKRTTHAQVFLIAIQPRQTALLQPMSAEVSSSVESIVATLNDVLKARQWPAGVESTNALRGKVFA